MQGLEDKSVAVWRFPCSTALITHVWTSRLKFSTWPQKFVLAWYYRSFFVITAQGPLPQSQDWHLHLPLLLPSLSATGSSRIPLGTNRWGYFHLLTSPLRRCYILLCHLHREAEFKLTEHEGKEYSPSKSTFNWSDFYAGRAALLQYKCSAGLHLILSCRMKLSARTFQGA